MTARPRVVFVTTYDPENQDLGGASWVDRKVLAALRVSYDVEILTIASPENPDDVALEVKSSNVSKVRTIWRMLTKLEPYQEAKFVWHGNWPAKILTLRKYAAEGWTIVSSQWPALLLAQHAEVPIDLHIAHNVDWVLAEKYDPALFRWWRNPVRMKRRERAMLGRPKALAALSTRDVKRLRREGIFASHLPLWSASTQLIPSGNKSVGFIGKMSWPPNHDAVTKLKTQVIPQVNDLVGESVSLVLAGRGAEDHTGEFIQSLGVVEDVNEFYSATDIVAIPRHGEATGISVKLLEAIEHGKAVVAPGKLAEDAGLPPELVIAADDDHETAVRIAEWFAADSHHRVTLDHSPGAGGPAETLHELLRTAVSSPPTGEDDDLWRSTANSWISDQNELIETAFAALAGAGSRRVQTVNLHHLYLARELPDFRAAIKRADHLTADGWPVVDALRATGIQVERVTGSDFLSLLLRDERIRGARIAMIGGSLESQEAFGEMLKGLGASMVLAESGMKEDWDPDHLARAIRFSGANLIFLAVTPPFGDLFAAELQQRLTTGLIIGVGGGLDMLVGARQRAPRIVQKVKMEWAYRMIQDPKHLARRYLVECLPTYVALKIRSSSGAPHADDKAPTA